MNKLIQCISILPFLIILLYSWFFFLKNNFNTVRLTPSYTDKLTQSNVFKKLNIKWLICVIFIIFIFIWVAFTSCKGVVHSFWFNHNCVSNFNINLLVLIASVLLISYLILSKTKHQNLIISNDYYFSLVNASVFILYLFFCNSLFNFLFILEIISIVIFYKFVVSKSWSNDFSLFFKKKNTSENVFSRNHTNVMFFQYWVNFFSSVILIISIVNIMFLYGSSDWFFIDLLNLISINNLVNTDLEFNTILWVFFFLCFFLKVGLTPSHLFKVEVYKGVPFVSIFFYTTFYFLGYFLFLTIMVEFYISSFKNYFYFFFIIFVVFGFFYTLFLLFDVLFTKAFFAYSTVVNTLAFVSLLIANM